MNRMPQNDPAFLNFQRNQRTKNRKKRVRTLLIASVTAVLLVALLVGGVLWIYRLGAKTETPKNPIPELPDMQNPGQPEDPDKEDPDKDDPDKEDPDKEDPDKEDPDKEDPDKEDPDKEDPDEKKTVVYIDAGHGFTNSYGVADKGTGDGTPYHDLTGKYESDLNLEVALKLKELLLAKGYDVLMSRESEVAEHLTINQRVARANASGADIFISIHANSAVATAKGARVYYSTANPAQVKCEKYAKLVAAALNTVDGASLKTVNVFNDRPDVGVIKAVNMPTVLIETCFLTNEEDAALAATEEWTLAMATGLANGIQSYLSQAAA